MDSYILFSIRRLFSFYCIVKNLCEIIIVSNIVLYKYINIQIYIIYV